MIDYWLTSSEQYFSYWLLVNVKRAVFQLYSKREQVK